MTKPFEYTLTYKGNQIYMTDQNSTEKILNEDLEKLANSIIKNKIMDFTNCNNKDLLITFKNGTLLLINYKEIINLKEFKPINDSYNNYFNKFKKIKKVSAISIGTSTTLLIASILFSSYENKLKEEEMSKVLTIEPITSEEKMELEKLNNKEQTATKKEIIDTLPLKNDTEIIDVSYTDNTDSDKFVKAQELYGNTIKKYANKYGLDYNLVLAICTQERGVHSSKIDDGGGLGLMQIQASQHPDGSSINTTTFENGKAMDTTYTFQLENYQTIDGNIEAGCALLRSYLNEFDGNIIAAIYAYNWGNNRIEDVINGYARYKNISKDEILNDVGNYQWTDFLPETDYDYLNLVMKYYNSDTLTYLMDSNNCEIKTITYQVNNTNNQMMEAKR
jgi:hypothetical protein